jgi:hypothetical protein
VTTPPFFYLEIGARAAMLLRFLCMKIIIEKVSTKL